MVQGRYIGILMHVAIINRYKILHLTKLRLIYQTIVLVPTKNSHLKVHTCKNYAWGVRALYMYARIIVLV